MCLYVGQAGKAQAVQLVRIQANWVGSALEALELEVPQHVVGKGRRKPLMSVAAEHGTQELILRDGARNVHVFWACVSQYVAPAMRGRLDVEKW